ncbi:MAG: hypothetical protein KTR31_38550 [Myxococcales bacterium]|nr:hypothetical protein [Myxococcales bacterium]
MRFMVVGAVVAASGCITFTCEAPKIAAGVDDGRGNVAWFQHLDDAFAHAATLDFADIGVCSGDWDATEPLRADGVGVRMELHGPADGSGRIHVQGDTLVEVSGTCSMFVRDVHITGASDAALVMRDSGSTLNVEGSTLQGNRQGIRVTDGDLSVATSDLIGNGPAEHGGAISYTGDTFLLVQASRLDDNEATGHGGALHVALPDTGLGPSVDLQNNEWTGNRADVGGAMALDLPGLLLLLNGQTVTGNTARDGGGLYAHGLNVRGSFMSTELRGNTAERGGGAFLEFSGIDDCIIEGNEAARGGGIYIADDPAFEGRPFATLAAVRDNVATELGGGLFVEPDVGVDVVSGEVTGNEAGLAGGGVYLSHGASLTSDKASWGAGDRDNTPDDVGTASGGAWQFEDETFECTGSEGCS